MLGKLAQIGLIFSLLAASCKTSESRVSSEAKVALSLNDVSILVPLHLVQDFRDQLPRLTGKGEGEAFAPDWLGREIASIQTEELQNRQKQRPSDPPGDVVKIPDDFSDFRFVALRLDPCANIRTAKSSPETCLPQLRLIWQRLVDQGPRDTGSTTNPGPFSRAKDSAVHTVYQLSKAELQTIVSLLRDLHKNASLDTKGMPLQPHPVLAKEGVSSPYFKGVLSIVGRFARASQLTHLSHFSAVNSGNVWQMTLFEVKGGKAERLDIPSVQPRKDEGTMQVQTLRRDPNDRTLIVTPKTSSPFVLSETIDLRADPGVKAAQEETLDRRIIENIAAIENPTLHDATNIDCASCHRALGTYAFARDREMKKRGKLEDAKQGYKSKTQNISFAVEPYMLDFTGPWALHMFSYFSDHPRITPRVINESAEVLDFIEQTQK